MLTASERVTVADIRKKHHAGMDRGYVDCDVMSLLAIIDRITVLANEGLTEEDHAILLDYSGERLTKHDQRVANLFYKFGSTIAAAKDEAALNAGLASDALMDRGLERLEECEKRTAEECAGIAVMAGWQGSPTAIATAIRRRFGLEERTP